ncbi:hypothetical protein [Phenylobacterium sp. 58.2.17]|uniref:hypothetical protein n=1 Tax=Phenylobacterium sp. 58.2.17 TaxID=2969306 RepID=UPI002264AB8E|nr:hypothetical protein [Phenylobacterium sp. 58.2.17]MCX7587278.1 hypothetical protein [Phenylobacterium sp. 58.2.17]
MPDAPWSVAWSGEQAFRLQPSQDFPGMLELDQKPAAGVGEPLFAAVHVTRQRRGMIDLLCHVCGEPTTRHDRCIFPVASGALVTLSDGSQRYGCNVPPIHRACATRALNACPHLSKLGERPLRCSGDEGQLIYRTDVTPGLEALNLTFPAGAEIVFSCYRLYGPEFTRAVVNARQTWEQLARSRRRL